MISRTVTVASTVGLHARPAALLAEAAEATGVEFTLTLDGEEADAASVLDIMSLGADHGDEVTISTEDDTATEALDKLAELISTDLDA
ncbi:HPr family phosphocarrier protein [Arcanobacterium pinnipediorum]|uniref:Phosphocarrier protein HPr n=1 Tax=Arcanobacterium pinnipediorum TaxID=1503041 RepID=A0ABY5AGN7_9ACTO|nr:HPr family phosphocarrier protein [Arcanobacterium pinnipediorum]USR79161.1 HPr family phosphocarrier protein [Arcanobacterium pinnipediorum]